MAVALCVFAVAPLFHPGYFWGAHDARHSVYFLLEFDRIFQDGIWYPRWAPDFAFGYGYPIFNIYSPGVYYLAEAFHLVGLGYVEAVKIVFGLGFLLSALSMYLAAKRFLGRKGALVAAVAYTYVPYRLVDVYVRGALAESFAFVWFPLALWAFFDLIVLEKTRFLIFGALTVAALVFTHYAMAVVFLRFLALYVVVLSLAYAWSQRRYGRNFTNTGDLAVAAARKGALALAAVLLGFSLSAIGLLPLVFEFQFVNTQQWETAYYDYRNHFVAFFQLFSPFWGFGESVPGPTDGMSFQLGAVPVALFVLSLTVVLRHRHAPGLKPYLPFFLFLQVVTLALAWLMLPQSATVWEALRLSLFTQFPWRLLALVAVSLAFLAGLVAFTGDPAEGGPSWPVLVALLAVVILGSYNYLSPQIIEPAEGPVSLAGLMRFEQSSGEMVGLTAWIDVRDKPTWSPLADVFVAGRPVTDKVVRDQLPPGTWAETLEHRSNLEKVRVRSLQEAQIAFYTAYHPGWRAYVNGREVPIGYRGPWAWMTVVVPPGESLLVLRFEDTLVRVVGKLVSFLSLLGLVIFLLIKRRKPRCLEFTSQTSIRC